MMKFTSWRSAFEYQQSLRDNEGDKFSLLETLETGNEALDTIIGAIDDSILWVAGIDNEEQECVVQYGVSPDKRWHSIVFDYSGSVLEPSWVDYDSYDELSDMLENEPDAKVIFDNIIDLMDVYEFLENGRIEPCDEADIAHLEISRKIRQSATEAMILKETLEELQESIDKGEEVDEGKLENALEILIKGIIGDFEDNESVGDDEEEVEVPDNTFSDSHVHSNVSPTYDSPTCGDGCDCEAVCEDIDEEVWLNGSASADVEDEEKPCPYKILFIEDREVGIKVYDSFIATESEARERMMDIVLENDFAMVELVRVESAYFNHIV